MNLVAPTVGVKCGLLFIAGFVEHLSLTQVAQQSATEFVAMIAINSVTPKAAAKQKQQLSTSVCSTNRPQPQTSHKI